MTPRSILLAIPACATMLSPAVHARDMPTLLAASADCSRAAAEASAQTGGRVLTVSSRNQDGQMVCVVTVIVPSSDGGRPRKRTLVLPQ